MAVQLGVTARNARLDAIATALGASPQLRLYTGAQPADCATADAGTLLATLTLPASPFAAASAGSKAKAGTWSGTASAAGTAAHYRLLDSTGTTCHCQGTVGLGSGDLSLDNNVLANGQTITINTFTLTDANA